MFRLAPVATATTGEARIRALLLVQLGSRNVPFSCFLSRVSETGASHSRCTRLTPDFPLRASAWFR